MTDKVLESLYFMRKFQTIQFFKLSKEESGISKSLVYALANDCYPLFSESPEFDNYAPFFKIAKDSVTDVLNYIDEIYLNDGKLTFYQLENHYGGRKSRSDLITIIRYAFLDNRFASDEFVTNLESDAPLEAHHLNDEFDAWEL